MQLRSYYLACLLILGVKCGPPSYKYDFRRNIQQKNQASQGFYFDPVEGKFMRGNPPPDLAFKSQKLREELSAEEDNQERYSNTKNSEALDQNFPRILWRGLIRLLSKKILLVRIQSYYNVVSLKLIGW